MKNTPKAISLNVTSTDKEAVRQGLAVARSIIRTKFMDAFDKGGTSLLCSLMVEISEAMELMDTSEEDAIKEYFLVANEI